jgi:hypothetical protein
MPARERGIEVGVEFEDVSAEVDARMEEKKRRREGEGSGAGRRRGRVRVGMATFLEGL